MPERPILEGIRRAKARRLSLPAVRRAIGLVDQMLRLKATLSDPPTQDVPLEDFEDVLADLIADIQRHRDELESIAQLVR